MRAYCYIANSGRFNRDMTVYIPATSNQMATELPVLVGQRDKSGWYRCQAVFFPEWRNWGTTIGKKIDLLEEVKRLEKMLKKEPGRARTKKPGIMGYQHMEDMANASIGVNRQITKYFVEFLRNKHKEEETDETRKQGKVD